MLPIFSLGALWLVLWRGRVRFMGILPVLAALALWIGAERPGLLVSGDGKLVGLIGPDGRALSAASGGGFAAESWLQNDGDLADQTFAAARDGFTGPKGERWFDLAGLQAVALSGKLAGEKLGPACASGALVILADKVDVAPDGCKLIDQSLLAATGPLAVWIETDGVRLEPTASDTRLWSRPMRAVVLPDLSPVQ